MGMGRRIEEDYRGLQAAVFPDLRRKWAVDLKLSDRELFEKYPMQDLFLDGKLHECFFYVYNHEALRIPDSWVDTMATFHRELKVAVT